MDYRRLYVDKGFESELKDIIFNDYDISEVIEENNSYKYHYLLSHLRHNLFNWYPFKSEGSLLEIGADYGQLTELFAKKVKEVVCVETSASRAEIISKRAPEAEVIICDFNDINTSKKFDYIILCNIFEYAKMFQDSKNPYNDYLNYLRKFLKEDGVILIAISNRFGLNYFAGFKEEHTDLYFAGINGYEDIDYVETFSKTELENLIVSAGFKNYKFFYPYPNHEFPLIINTDKFVNKIPYERRLDYFDNRYDLFREDVINQIFAKEEMADYFSNSFLVEIRNADKKSLTDDIDFVKINSDRIDKFKTITTIKSDELVYKSSFSPKADNHIKNMYNQSKFKLGKIKCLDCELLDNSIRYKLLKEESLETRILNSIMNNNKGEFFRLLEDYYNALFYESFESQDYATAQFMEVFKRGTDVVFHCHEKSNIDLIFSNIFIINNEYVAIDYEWTFDFPIPLEYIFYRVLLHYTLTNNVFNEFTSIEEIFNHFNLDTGYFDLFRIWDHNFIDYVFGYLPKPNQNIMPQENFRAMEEEFEEYVGIYLDSDGIDEDKLKMYKKDMVINQKRIIHKKANQIHLLNQQLTERNKQIAELNNKIIEKDKKIEQFATSKSWKITTPLRIVTQLLKNRRG